MIVLNGTALLLLTKKLLLERIDYARVSDATPAASAAAGH
jgi:hypothetical protein